MKKEIFFEDVKNLVEEMLGKETSIKEIVKPAEAYTGLHLNGETVAACVSLDKLYEDYANDVVTAAEKAVAVIKKGMHMDINLSLTRNWDCVKEKVYKVLLPKTNGVDLEKVPYKEVAGDMVEFYYVDVKAGEEDGRFMLNNELIQKYGVTKEEVEAQANANTQALKGLRIFPIGDIIEVYDSMEYFVMTNNESYYGAATILYPGVEKEIKKVIKREYFLIPSSVHEWLIIEKGKVPLEYINSMIQSINENSLLETEVLSDHAYELVDGVLHAAT